MLAVVILCMLWVGFVNDIGFHMGGTALSFARLPITIGIYSFCYGSHSVFPNIYSSMEEPSRFPSVLLVRYYTFSMQSTFCQFIIFNVQKSTRIANFHIHCSFSIACSLYAGVAICGFSMFGDSTKTQFTLNMPQKYSASVVAAWMVVRKKESIRSHIQLEK